VTLEQARAVLGLTPAAFWALAATGELPVTGGRAGIEVSDAAMEEYISRKLPETLAAAS